MRKDRTVRVSLHHINDAPRVHIEFGRPKRAKSYLQILQNSNFQQQYQLNPQIEANGYAVSFLLPREISVVEGSIKCGGLRFIFSEQRFADDWVRHMTLWDKDADGKVFVKWNLSSDELRKELETKHKIPLQPRPNQTQTSGTVTQNIKRILRSIRRR